MANKATDRVSVLLGTFKVPVKLPDGTRGEENRKVFTNCQRRVAERFGMGITALPLAGTTANEVVVRGTKGAGSVRIPTGVVRANGSEQYYSIPMPGHFNLQETKVALAAAIKTNAPSKFVSKHGRTHSIVFAST